MQLLRGYRGAAMRTALLLSSALIPSFAQAQSFPGLGFLPGTNNSFAAAVTNGLVVVGDSPIGGIDQGFRWTPSGGMVGLGLLTGGTFSPAAAVSGDGSVVVGVADSTAFPNGAAFRWTQSTGIVSLGILAGGTFSQAFGVNSDGSVVVGYSESAAVPFGEAFRWTQATGMVGLGTLPGGDFSQATAVSANGTVVVGQSTSPAFPGGEAFRWTQATGMVGLGVLAGGNSGSGAQAVNSDGSVVVGFSDSAIGGQAFRWTQATGMVGLGFLPGGTQSAAYGVSGDGSVVVGYSSANFVHTAFRWTQSTGMQSISALVTASGLNITGWKLIDANGISPDGTVIVGSGLDPAGHAEAWLVRCATVCGFITPSTVSQSFSGQSAIGQTGNAAIGNTLGTLTQVATESGANQGGNSPYAVFGYGGYDSDPAASGSLGLTAKLADNMIAGAMVSANYLRSNMVYDGNATMRGGAGGVFLARVPDAGLQWLVGVSGITLKSDITRGYLNATTPTSSQGSTTGNGAGAMARIGWTFNRVWRMTQVTPFASYTFTRMRFNGYSETTGPFPAQFNAFNDSANIVRVGADARYTFAPGKWVWGTLASAHRLNNSATADISGTVIGLFGMTAPAAPVAKDWIETTAGVRWPAWKNGAVNASVTASIPTSYATTYQVRLGLTQTF